MGTYKLCEVNAFNNRRCKKKKLVLTRCKKRSIYVQDLFKHAYRSISPLKKYAFSTVIRDIVEILPRDGRF